jgi:hypothetical protein
VPLSGPESCAKLVLTQMKSVKGMIRRFTDFLSLWAWAECRPPASTAG